jgi:nitrite reductase/ring-hydroxylating ferredoxin subunit
MGLIKKWVEVAKESEFDGVDRKQVFLEGRDILVLKIEEDYFAIHNVCTHAFALMVGGFVEGYEIECPLHGARFDVRTGMNLTPPAVRPLDVFGTKTDNGVVYVRI